jgi:hypothetical protein
VTELSTDLLMELGGAFPGTTEIFTYVDANTQMLVQQFPHAELNFDGLKKVMPKLKVAHLGAELSVAMYDALRARYKKNSRVDLTGADIGVLTPAAIGELPGVFPAAEAVFMPIVTPIGRWSTSAPAGLVAWYRAELWNAAAAEWLDLSGNGHVGKAISGVPTLVAEPGHGASGTISAVCGPTGTSFDFGDVVSSTFTVASLCRYTGDAQGRILQGDRSNWLHGHWRGARGYAHYGSSSDDLPIAAGEPASVCPEHDWVIMIGSNAGDRTLRANGTNVGAHGEGTVSLIQSGSKPSRETPVKPARASKFTTTWSPTLKHDAIELVSPTLAKNTSGSGECVWASDELPKTGLHYWEVTITKANKSKGQAMGNCYFVGVLNHTNTSDTSIRGHTGAWGISDDGDSEGIRVNGRSSGVVRPQNAAGKAFGSGERVGVLADMDARPRTLQYFREGVRLQDVVVSGFDEQVRLAAVAYNDGATADLDFPAVPEGLTAEELSRLAPGNDKPTRDTPVGTKMIFEKVSSYEYHTSCIEGEVELLQIKDPPSTPPVQCKWPSGFRYFVNYEDLTVCSVGRDAVDPDADMEPISSNGNQRLVINAGIHGAEQSDWAVAEVMTWDRALSSDEVHHVERYMFERLGLPHPDLGPETEDGPMPPMVQFKVSDVKVAADVIVEIKAQWPTLKCAQLGCEISPVTYANMAKQYKNTRRLDLTCTGDEDDTTFSHLSAAGLAELPALFPHTENIFWQTRANISDVEINAIKADFKSLRGIVHGVSARALDALDKVYTRDRPWLHFKLEDIAEVSTTFLLHIAEIFPDAEAIFIQQKDEDGIEEDIEEEADGTPEYEYKVDTETRTADEHEALAQAWGGHLSSVTSLAENVHLQNLFADAGGGSDQFFIGGKRKASSSNARGEGPGDWEWMDGTRWRYMNWNSGEPNNMAETRVEVYGSNGMWNDIGADSRRGAVYKRVVEKPKQFTVSGCGLDEFNGEYVVDAAQDDGVKNGKPCYRKNAASSETGEQTVNYCNGFWYLCKNHSGSWYRVPSTANLPPKRGWGTGTKGSGAQPHLQFPLREKVVLPTTISTPNKDVSNRSSTEDWHQFETVALHSALAGGTVSCTWKDQGYGGQKGRVVACVMRDGIELQREDCFGIAQHSEVAVSYTIEDTLLTVAQPGDELRFLYNVGGGGGHELFITNFSATVLFNSEQESEPDPVIESEIEHATLPPPIENLLDFDELKKVMPSLKVAHLGLLIGPAEYMELLAQYEDTQLVDLSDAKFARLSDKALAELTELFPDSRAIFLPSVSAVAGEQESELSHAILDKMKTQLRNLQCLHFGRGVSAAIYAEVLHHYEDTRRLDLRHKAFSNLSPAGLDEIPRLFPDAEAIFCRYCEPLDGPPEYEYKVDTETRTADEHEALAQAWGGHLSSVTSLAENEHLQNLFADAGGGSDQFFIGGKRKASSSNARGEGPGDWEWMDGTRWRYMNWNSGEPNNMAETRVEVYGSNGMWNDIGADSRRGAVYKRVVEKPKPILPEEIVHAVDRLKQNMKLLKIAHAGFAMDPAVHDLVMAECEETGRMNLAATEPELAQSHFTTTVEMEALFVEEGSIVPHPRQATQMVAVKQPAFLPENQSAGDDSCAEFTNTGNNVRVTGIEGYALSVLDVPFPTSGVHTAVVRMIDFGKNCGIGVVTSMSAVVNSHSRGSKAWIGNGPNGWVLFNDGDAGHTGSWKGGSYDRYAIRKDAEVSVTIDADRHTISFVVNGTERNDVYGNIPDTVYLAVSISQPGGSFELKSVDWVDSPTAAAPTADGAEPTTEPKPSPTDTVSIWRPVLPAGHVLLGDHVQLGNCEPGQPMLVGKIAQSMEPSDVETSAEPAATELDDQAASHAQQALQLLYKTAQKQLSSALQKCDISEEAVQILAKSPTGFEVSLLSELTPEEMDALGLQEPDISAIKKSIGKLETRSDEPPADTKVSGKTYSSTKTAAKKASSKESRMFAEVLDAVKANNLPYKIRCLISNQSVSCPDAPAATGDASDQSMFSRHGARLSNEGLALFLTALRAQSGDATLDEDEPDSDEDEPESDSRLDVGSALSGIFREDDSESIREDDSEPDASEIEALMRGGGVARGPQHHTATHGGRFRSGSSVPGSGGYSLGRGGMGMGMSYGSPSRQPVPPAKPRKSALEVFKRFDTNNDGFLQRAEAKSMMAQLEADGGTELRMSTDQMLKKFGQADKDQNDTIDIDEFRVLWDYIGGEAFKPEFMYTEKVSTFIRAHARTILGIDGQDGLISRDDSGRVTRGAGTSLMSILHRCRKVAMSPERRAVKGMELSTSDLEAIATLIASLRRYNTELMQRVPCLQDLLRSHTPGIECLLLYLAAQKKHTELDIRRLRDTAAANELDTLQPPLGHSERKCLQTVLEQLELVDLTFAYPRGYELMWQKKTDKQMVSIWQPLAQPGYVSLGVVTSSSPKPPSITLVRCVKIDLVVTTTAGANIWRSESLPSKKTTSKLEIQPEQEMGTTKPDLGLERTLVGFVKHLEKVDLLDGLSLAERTDIAQGLETLDFTEAQPIVEEGDAADGLFLVFDGTARAESRQGEVLREYGAGDFFGELALSSGKPRSATVRATSSTVTVLKLPVSAYEKLTQHTSVREQLGKQAESYEHSVESQLDAGGDAVLAPHSADDFPDPEPEPDTDRVARPSVGPWPRRPVSLTLPLPTDLSEPGGEVSISTTELPRHREGIEIVNHWHELNMLTEQSKAENPVTTSQGALWTLPYGLCCFVPDTHSKPADKAFYRPKQQWIRSNNTAVARGLTSAAVAELYEMFPGIEMLFAEHEMVDSAAKAALEALADDKENKLKMAALGFEITAEAFDKQLELSRKHKLVNIGRDDFADLSERGLKDLVHMCPDVQAIFTCASVALAWDTVTVESDHDYKADTDETEVVKLMDAPATFRITFDPRCKLENKHDTLTISCPSAQGEDFERVIDNGSDDSAWGELLLEDACGELRFRLQSDKDTEFWGYHATVSLVSGVDNGSTDAAAGSSSSSSEYKWHTEAPMAAVNETIESPSSGGFSGYKAAVCQVPFPSTGTHYVEVRILERHDSMAVGVVESWDLLQSHGSESKGYIGNGRHGWCLFNDGDGAHNGSWRTNSPGISTSGTTVKMVFNADRGELGWVVDGNDRGVVFDGLPTGRGVYFAVTLAASGGRLKILSTSFPMGGGEPTRTSGDYFRVRGCGMDEFNGKYVVDTAKTGGVKNGKPCYCKNAAGSHGGNQTVNFAEGSWYMCHNHSGSWYKVASSANLPPTDGWRQGSSGSGAPPQLNFYSSSTAKRSGVDGSPIISSCTISANFLEMLKATCSSLTCVQLASEITQETYLKLMDQYKQSMRVDLTGDECAQVTLAGLAEVAATFPDAQQVFVPRGLVGHPLRTLISLDEQGEFAEGFEKGPFVKCEDEPGAGNVFAYEKMGESEQSGQCGGWTVKVSKGHWLRVSASIKFLGDVPEPTDNFGFKLHGSVRNEWLHECTAHEWHQISSEGFAIGGDSSHVLLIFDTMVGPMKVLVKDLQCDILEQSPLPQATFEYVGLFKDASERAFAKASHRSNNIPATMETFSRELQEKSLKVGYVALQDKTEVFTCLGEPELDFARHGELQKSEAHSQSAGLTVKSQAGEELGKVDVIGGGGQNAVYRFAIPEQESNNANLVLDTMCEQLKSLHVFWLGLELGSPMEFDKITAIHDQMVVDDKEAVDDSSHCKGVLNLSDLTVASNMTVQGVKELLRAFPNIKVLLMPYDSNFTADNLEDFRHESQLLALFTGLHYKPFQSMWKQYVQTERINMEVSHAETDEESEEQGWAYLEDVYENDPFAHLCGAWLPELAHLCPHATEFFSSAPGRVPLPSAVYTPMRTMCDRLQCTILGAQIQGVVFDSVLRTQYVGSNPILQLTSSDFTDLTNDGLLELAYYCPGVTALFVRSRDMGGKMTKAGLKDFKSRCADTLDRMTRTHEADGPLTCCLLGREIHKEGFDDMHKEYEKSKEITVSGEYFRDLTGADREVLEEVAGIFPQVRGIKSEPRDTLQDKDRQRKVAEYLAELARAEGDEHLAAERDVAGLESYERACALDPQVPDAKKKLSKLRAEQASVKGKALIAEGKMDLALQVIEEGLSAVQEGDADDCHTLKEKLEQSLEECNIISKVEIVSKRLVPKLAALDAGSTEESKKLEDRRKEKPEQGKLRDVEEKILPFFQGTLDVPVSSELYYLAGKDKDAQNALRWSENEEFKLAVQHSLEDELVHKILRCPQGCSDRKCKAGHSDWVSTYVCEHRPNGCPEGFADGFVWLDKMKKAKQKALAAKQDVDAKRSTDHVLISAETFAETYDEAKQLLACEESVPAKHWCEQWRQAEEKFCSCIIVPSSSEPEPEPAEITITPLAQAAMTTPEPDIKDEMQPEPEPESNSDEGLTVVASVQRGSRLLRDHFKQKKPEASLAVPKLPLSPTQQLRKLGMEDLRYLAQFLLVEMNKESLRKLFDSPAVVGRGRDLLDRAKIQLFSYRRQTERDATRMCVSNRQNGVEVTPLRAAIELRDEQLLSNIVRWLVNAKDRHLQLLTSMPQLCDDVVLMLKSGYVSYAHTLLKSVDMVESTKQMLIPGVEKFGSWQPWELSRMTGRVERHKFDDESSSMIVTGSRFHGATGFWFQALGKDRETDGNDDQQGLPVESWTLPLFCSFGMVRLIRAAAVAGETKLFVTPAFRISIEWLWSSFGRSHFQWKFANFAVYVLMWVAFTLNLAEQTSQRFLAIPHETQLLVLVLGMCHLISQRALRKVAALARSGSSITASICPCTKRLQCYRKLRKIRVSTRGRSCWKQLREFYRLCLCCCVCSDRESQYISLQTEDSAENKVKRTNQSTFRRSQSQGQYQELVASDMEQNKFSDEAKIELSYNKRVQQLRSLYGTLEADDFDGTPRQLSDDDKAQLRQRLSKENERRVARLQALDVAKNADQYTWDAIQHRNRRRQLLVRAFALVVWPIPIVMSGIVIYHHMITPDIVIAVLVAPLVPLTLGRTWDEFQQIAAEVAFAHSSMVDPNKMQSPQRLALEAHCKQHNKGMLKHLNTMVLKYGESNFLRMMLMTQRKTELLRIIDNMTKQLKCKWITLRVTGPDAERCPDDKCHLRVTAVGDTCTTQQPTAGSNLCAVGMANLEGEWDTPEENVAKDVSLAAFGDPLLVERECDEYVVHINNNQDGQWPKSAQDELDHRDMSSDEQLMWQLMRKKWSAHTVPLNELKRLPTPMLLRAFDSVPFAARLAAVRALYWNRTEADWAKTLAKKKVGSLKPAVPARRTRERAGECLAQAAAPVQGSARAPSLTFREWHLRSSIAAQLE